IFVCTHGEHDCRCGQIGNAVYDTIKRSLESSPELSKKLSVWRTSHLGGHKYAAVAVVYPPGDWFGRLTPENAPEFLSNLAGGKTPVDHWRGRVGLDKHEMVAMSKR
ncbi:Sucraseferredoxin-like protein, partial [Ramicandelaber brevisporus]